jgi:hypothetical protein
MNPIIERLFMLLLKRGSGELLTHSILACVHRRSFHPDSDMLVFHLQQKLLMTSAKFLMRCSRPSAMAAARAINGAAERRTDAHEVRGRGSARREADAERLRRGSSKHAAR